MNVKFTETISWIRFPLALLVVLLHSKAEIVGYGADLDSMPVLSFFTTLFTGLLSRIAVPAFFFISGYLFFINMKIWSWTQFADKLYRRVYTLLIPYLSWNALVLLLYFIVQTFKPDLFNSSHKLISDYGPVEILMSFWDYKGNQPICYQLWFVRDLIIMLLITPLIYALIYHLKKIRYATLISLLVMTVILNGGGKISSDDPYFVIGACFPLLGINIEIFLKKIGIWAFSLYLIYMGCSLFSSVKLSLFFVNAGLMNGVCGILWLTSFKRIYCINIKESLQASTFFIYASHGIILMMVSRLLLKFFKVGTDAGFSLVYILAPFLTIMIGYILYLSVRNFRICNIFTGGRK